MRSAWTAISTADLNLLGRSCKDSLKVLYNLLLMEDAANAEELIITCRGTVRASRSGDPTQHEHWRMQELFRRWYASLERDDPDFGVYDSPWYLAEAYASWAIYSRKYLLMIQKPNQMPPDGVVAHMGKVGTVVDLGCGIGFSTAVLSQLFPAATVFGTNVPGSLQTRIACRVADPSMTGEPSFHVVPGMDQIEGPVSLVFASEYFEHFADPIGHLREVIRSIVPTSFLLANSFTPDAIGHFNTYPVDGEQIAGSRTGKAFASELRTHGYRRVKTKLWNKRPDYWTRAAQ